MSCSPWILHGILEEDREQKIRAKKRNRANANSQIWTCLSPLKDMRLLSSWTPRIWGFLHSPLSIPPPIAMVKLCCDLSLPLWQQFPRRVLLDICCKRVRSLRHRTKQQVECDAGREQESLSGAGSKRMQEQVASCLSCSEIGGTELCASVAPKGFGSTEGNRPVWLSSS